MLINVFGRWLNPEKITYISAATNGAAVSFDGFAYNPTTEKIAYNIIYFKDKTADEIANEISNQITPKVEFPKKKLKEPCLICEGNDVLYIRQSCVCQSRKET